VTAGGLERPQGIERGKPSGRAPLWLSSVHLQA
jgi:hypothetical protein